jgi:class 3 adenylate cyclase
MARISFSEHESERRKAIVVSFDLAGFSNFCNQPDASTTAPRLMKHTFDLLNNHLHDYGTKEKPVVPSFNKFSGDGALMIWLLNPELQDFPQEFCNLLTTTMRAFQEEFSRQALFWEAQWRVHKLPKRMRVGIAAGVVYPVKEPYAVFEPEPYDYVGYCINLAVRLQDYCPDIGFLVHGVLYPMVDGMENYEATNMKGAQIEPVRLFKADKERVQSEEFNSKFRR